MRTLLLLLFTAWHLLGSAQNFNRPVPPDFMQYEFVQNDTTNFGHYLMNTFPQQMQPDGISGLAIIDHLGYLVWYQPDDTVVNMVFDYDETLQKFSYAEGGMTNGVFPVRMLDQQMEHVDSLFETEEGNLDKHEFLLLDNGGYLTFNLFDTILDLSMDTFDGVQGSATTTVLDVRIIEYDANKNVVFTWTGLDYIDPTEFYDFYGYNPNRFDYVHPNALALDADGNIMMSLRALNAVYCIDRNNGDVLWRLGGKISTFTFVNDVGFSAQHDIRLLDNGNFSIFDNQNMGAPPRRSRGVEYALNLNDSTATKVWEYVHPGQVFSRAMGNYQRLNDQQHHLISYGYIFRPNPSVTLIDDSENILTEFTFEDSIFTYRTRIRELGFTFPQPEINCDQNGGMVTLSAPLGYTDYLWSTGETGPSIVVADTGTYMVWVDYGVGMLGSFPFYLDDLANPCAVGVDEYLSQGARKLIGIYDVLGREVSETSVPQLLIYRYDNGTSEKRFQLLKRR